MTSRARFIPRDPRFLIVAFFLVLTVPFVIRHNSGLLLVLLYIVVIHILAGLPIRALYRHAANVLLIAVLIVIVNAYLVKGEPLDRPFTFLSRQGLAAGVFYALRVFVLYSSLAVFLAITPHEAVAYGLSAVVRPFSPNVAGQTALLSFLTIGFLPLFADEFQRVNVAQRFRGGGLGGGLLERISGVRLLLVPLILSAIHRSGQLAMAVELRRVGETIGNLLVFEKPAAKDYIFLGLTIVVLCVAFVLP